jgi:hypothetical protein
LRIFIDIGAFRPEKSRIEGVDVRRGTHEFEATIPSRGTMAQIRRYSFRQAAERFLEFFVPSIIAIVIWCIIADFTWFFAWVAAVILIAGPAAYVIHRRIVGALDPIRAAWSVQADSEGVRVYRSDEEGQELASQISFGELQGMNSHRIEDDTLFDYMHDQYSNELELTSSRGGIRFAEGLDFETCETIVTEFGKYVDLLRNERAASQMPGVHGLEA